MSELVADIHQIHLIITPTTATEADSTIHPQLLIDPTQHHWPHQRWTLLPLKTAQAEVVSTVHQHQSMTQLSSLGSSHRGDRLGS